MLAKLSVIRIIMVTIFFMMLGTLLELYLLDHYEDVWQLIPIVCILSSLLILIYILFKPYRFLLVIFQFLMGVTAVSGLLGIVLHLKENYEFEREMVPSLSTWDLLCESLSGALPSLAPGSLIVLALIGYSYTQLIKTKNT